LLVDEERCGLDELEKRYGRTVSINSRPGFHIEQFEIAVG
jgi:ribonuclease G